MIMSEPKSCPIMKNKYALIGIVVGLFFAGLGIGYTVFVATYNPFQTMMQNP